MNKISFLAIIKDKINIVENLDEIKAMTFDSVEDAQNMKVFEIEFKRKINLKPMVKVDIE